MKALVVAQRPSDYTEMMRAALALRNRGFRISIVYNFMNSTKPEDQAVEAELNTLEANGTIEKAIYFNREVSDDPDAPPTRMVPRRSIEGRLTAIWHKVRPLFNLTKAYRDLLKAYRDVIRAQKPDVIILPEDVAGMVTPVFIKAGHLEGVPSIVLPYTICNEQEAFRSLVMFPWVQVKGLNRVIAWFFPEWVMEQDGRRIMRLPAGHVVGHWLTKCLPPDPWMFCSGWADAIAVESEAMRDYYRVSGVPSSRLRVVGAVYDDELAELRGDKAERRKVLDKQLGLYSSKPLLVVGGCPNQSGICPRFVYRSMEALAKALGLALRPLQEQYNVVFRPHPNFLPLGNLVALEGIPFTTLPTSYLVALCDAYVGFASATIRWAISCGVPVINYDVFGYGYSDFRHVPSVETVTDHAGFLGALQRLPKRLTSSDGERWGKLDGKATERIVDLIRQVAA